MLTQANDSSALQVTAASYLLGTYNEATNKLIRV